MTASRLIVLIGALMGLVPVARGALALPPSPIPAATRAAAFEAPADGLSAFGQADAGYLHTFAGGDDAGRFDLARAELGLAFWRRAPGVGFVLQLDAIRSAGPDSVFGIDGNALVLTLARAYGAYEPFRDGPVTASFRAGLIPDPWLERLEAAYRLRSARATGAEAFGLVARNDLGLVADLGVPSLGLDLRLAVLNGEGARQVELDRSRTVVALLAWHTSFQLLGDAARLDVSAAWRAGTQGAGGGRADRLHAAITLDHPHATVGVEGWLADGHLGRPELSPAGLGAFLAGDFGLPVGGVFFRYDYHDRDRADLDTDLAVFSAGLYADLLRGDPILPRLRLWAGWRGERLGRNAGAIAGAPDATETDTVFVSLEAIGVFSAAP